MEVKLKPGGRTDVMVSFARRVWSRRSASRVAKPSDIIAANHRTGEVLTVNKAEIPHEKHNADKIRGRAAPRR